MANLNEFQKTVVEETNKNICVIAHAATGKSEVITQRTINLVKRQGVMPNAILCVSFSKDASTNLDKRFNRNGISGVECKTFHALALRIVKTAYPNNEVWNNDYEKIKVVKKICIDNRYSSNYNKIPTGEIMSYIASRQMKVDFDIDTEYTEDILEKIFDKYSEYKNNHNLIEFNDMVEMAVSVLKNNKRLRDLYSNKWEYIMMDEFQDVSGDQYEFAKIIGANANVMVVGDVQQGIYAFRGGCSKYMLKFIGDFNADRLFLPINYRCSNKIVTMANKLTKVSEDAQKNKYIDSIPFRESDKEPVIMRFNSDTEEHKFVLNKIKDGAFDYKENLILARTNGQLYDIFSYLIENDVPCKIIGSLPFYKISEVATIINYLKVAHNPDDNLAVRAIANKPNRFLPNTFLDELEEKAGIKGSIFNEMLKVDRKNFKVISGINDIREIINDINHGNFNNVGEIVDYLLHNLDLMNCFTERCQDEQAIDEVKNNIEHLRARCEKHKTIGDFMDAMQKEYDACNKIDDKNAVILETIHKSKGAECPRVFVTGFSEGLLPHSKMISVEEELHIFYVGVTRARDELYVMHSDHVGSKDYTISSFVRYVSEYLKNS